MRGAVRNVFHLITGFLGQSVMAHTHTHTLVPFGASKFRASPFYLIKVKISRGPSTSTVFSTRTRGFRQTKKGLPINWLAGNETSSNQCCIKNTNEQPNITRSMNISECIRDIRYGTVQNILLHRPNVVWLKAYGFLVSINRNVAIWIPNRADIFFYYYWLLLFLWIFKSGTAAKIQKSKKQKFGRLVIDMSDLNMRYSLELKVMSVVAVSIQKKRHAVQINSLREEKKTIEMT